MAEDALGERPIWTEQMGAFGDAKRHPSDSEISVAFVGLVPHETASPTAGYTWFPMRDLPPLSPRQRAPVTFCQMITKCASFWSDGFIALAVTTP